ncbi:hypothetical protein COO60DRAFT_1458701 [Scenedesmus sp. NREL 46B-D3]|nr:hypothetical protein COO60DRAFT_1458701 [Scenedesmus sp. NREL 46B-D3]
MRCAVGSCYKALMSHFISSGACAHMCVGTSLLEASPALAAEHGSPQPLNQIQASHAASLTACAAHEDELCFEGLERSSCYKSRVQCNFSSGVWCTSWWRVVHQLAAASCEGPLSIVQRCHNVKDGNKGTHAGAVKLSAQTSG